MQTQQAVVAQEAYDSQPIQQQAQQVVQPDLTAAAALESFREYALANVQDEELRTSMEGIKDVATVAGFAALFGAAVFGANVAAKAEAKAQQERIRKDMRSSLEDLVKNHKSSAQVIIRKIRETYLNDEWLEQQNFKTGTMEGGESIWNALSVQGHVPDNYSSAFNSSTSRFGRFVDSMEADIRQWGKEVANLVNKAAQGQQEKWVWESTMERIKHMQHPMEENLGVFMPLQNELGRLSVMYPATDYTPWYRGRYNFAPAPASYPRPIKYLDKKGVKAAASALIEMIQFFFTKNKMLATSFRWMNGVDIFYTSSFSQLAKQYETATGKLWDDSFVAQVGSILEKGRDPLSEAQEAYGKVIHKAIVALDMLIRQSMTGNVNVSTELKPEEDVKPATESYSVAQEGLIGVGVLAAAVIGAVWYDGKKKKEEHRRIVGEQKKKEISDLVKSYGTKFDAIVEKIQETYLNDEWLDQKRFVLGPIANVKTVWEALSVDGRMPTNIRAAWKDSEKAFDAYGEKMQKSLEEFSKHWYREFEALTRREVTGDYWKRLLKEFEEAPFPLDKHVADYNVLSHRLGRCHVTVDEKVSWLTSSKSRYRFQQTSVGNPRAVPAMDREEIKEAARTLIDMADFFFNHNNAYAFRAIDDMDTEVFFLSEDASIVRAYEKATGKEWENEPIGRIGWIMYDRDDSWSEAQQTYATALKNAMHAIDLWINSSFQK